MEKRLLQTSQRGLVHIGTEQRQLFQRFLPDLGLTSVDQFVGRTVEEVIPNT